jgi:hypothetical protein
MKYFLSVFFFTFCLNASATSLEECYKKGVAYEKEAGVIVKPSVQTRCSRTTSAFDSFKPYCVDIKKREQVRREQANNPARLAALEEIWSQADKEYPKCSS